MTQAAAADVRRWAQTVGIAVGQRGRLSPQVRTAFEAAHEAARGKRTAQAKTEMAMPRKVRVVPAVGGTSVRRISARQR